MLQRPEQQLPLGPQLERG
ncbi:hypothetical protein VCHC50A1_2590, partial [Vibrio cholerae HC-50A1]